MASLLKACVLLSLCAGSVLSATNPSGFLLPGQFGGPRSILFNGTYYAFASNDLNKPKSGIKPAPIENVPVASSKHLGSGWTYENVSVLPNVGAWVRPSKPNVLVPAVHSYNESYFVMYYTANHINGSLCVGTATSTTILGTYKPQANPMICDGHKVIEAGTPFMYKGKAYIVYKNQIIKNSAIHLQQLSEDRLSVTGPVHELIHEQPGLFDVEGPAMTFNPQNNGWPILLFAPGNFHNDSYRVQYAVAPTNALIPSSNDSYVINSTPLLQTGNLNGVELFGPGSASFPSLDQFPGQLAFESDRNSSTIVGRSLMTATITYHANNTLAILPS